MSGQSPAMPACDTPQVHAAVKGSRWETVARAIDAWRTARSPPRRAAGPPRRYGPHPPPGRTQDGSGSWTVRGWGPEREASREACLLPRILPAPRRRRHETGSDAQGAAYAPRSEATSSPSSFSLSRSICAPFSSTSILEERMSRATRYWSWMMRLTSSSIACAVASL